MPAAGADLKKPYLKDNSQRVQRAELENWSPALKVASAEHGCVSLFRCHESRRDFASGSAGRSQDRRIEERPKPVLEAAKVLISVKAAELNRADLIQRDGRYPAPPDAPADSPVSRSQV